VPEPLGPYVDGAALMRDGLLSGCGVQQVWLPGYPEGHPRIASATPAAAPAALHAVAFSPAGRTLAVACDDRTVRRYAVADGALTKELPGLNDWVTSVVFSADGKWLAAGGGGDVIRLWDAESGKPTGATSRGGSRVRGWVQG